MVVIFFDGIEILRIRSVGNKQRWGNECDYTLYRAVSETP